MRALYTDREGDLGVDFEGKKNTSAAIETRIGYDIVCHSDTTNRA